MLSVAGRGVASYERMRFPVAFLIISCYSYTSIVHLKNFEAELMRLFGTSDPEHFQPPCFGSQLNLDTIHLSDSKRNTISKLLCIIGSVHPQLEFTPLIPAIVAVLVKRLEPDDALACMAAMIEGHSIPAIKRQDWAYFPLHRRDYLVFGRVFEDLLQNHVPKVLKHVLKVQLLAPEYVPPWDKILSCFFVGILPREIIFRIFDSYLVEGYKIILRFAIAHVIIRQEAVLNTTSPMLINEALLRPEKFSTELQDRYVKAILNVKFDRSIIQRYRNRRRKHSVEDFDAEDKLLIFQRPLPQLNSPSSFMRDEDWAALWSWIPARFRLLNLELSFTTSEHGRHLLTLLNRCKTQEPILLLIETLSGKVLGAYISKALTLDYGPAFYGTGESFLFGIKPKTIKYEWDIKSGSSAFICITDSFVAMGTGSDFGLWIDRFLEHVTSAASVTFKNEPLLDRNSPEDLQIYCLEAFTFV